MKTKKSISLILALVMVLAMSCGAWAADAVVSADGVAKSASGALNATGANRYGLWALNSAGAISGGSISYTGGGTISTNGNNGYGAYAYQSSDVNVSGNIITQGGTYAFGIVAREDSTAKITGNISTFGERGHGALARMDSYVEVIGNIATEGFEARGAQADHDASIHMVGNIVTEGDAAYAVYVMEGSHIELIGDVETHGDMAHGAYATTSATNFVGDSSISIQGNVATTGESAHGLYADDNAEISLTDGSISVADNDTSWSMVLSGDSEIDLSNVTAEGKNLLKATDSGALTATDGSKLAGDVLHDGSATGTLDITLSDSTWNGAAEAIDDIGTIDITLIGSDWNVTGDTNTNGKVTGDEDSKIDFNGTPDTITVVIDSLEGELGSLNIKIDDTLIIKNSNGTITDITSSNPDVVEIVMDPVTKEITVVSKGDGDTEITIEFSDGSEVTFDVVSGAGSRRTGGGGSSGCNAGLGILALLGLAFVYKKK